MGFMYQAKQKNIYKLAPNSNSKMIEVETERRKIKIRNSIKIEKVYRVQDIQMGVQTLINATLVYSPVTKLAPEQTVLCNGGIARGEKNEKEIQPTVNIENIKSFHNQSSGGETKNTID